MTEAARKLLTEFDSLSPTDQCQLATEILRRAAQNGEAFAGVLSPIKPSPQILDWARKQFTEEEIVAGIQEIQETGGMELSEFIHDLEAINAANDRNAS